MRVSVSTISSNVAVVSRWSFNQESVNFIVSLLLRAQAADKRRNIKRSETVMVEPANIRLEEGAQVRHAIFQHRDTVDSHPPGEALDLVGVETAIAQHIRMDHAAAEDLQPILTLAEADFAAFARTLDVDLRRG